MDDSAHRAQDDGGTAADLAEFECSTLNTLLDAARLVEAAAEDLEWTVVDPVDLPGMRRAAALLRLHAIAHVQAEHAAEVTAERTDPDLHRSPRES